MLTRPIGITEQFTQGPLPVPQNEWRNFCPSLNAAQALTSLLLSTFPCSLSVVDATDSYGMFQESANATARIFVIMGQDQNGNVINELAGELLDRRTIPQPGVDQNIGAGDRYPAGAVLVPALQVSYGYAEVIWTMPVAPTPPQTQVQQSTAPRQGLGPLQDPPTAQ